MNNLQSRQIFEAATKHIIQQALQSRLNEYSTCNKSRPFEYIFNQDIETGPGTATVGTKALDQWFPP